MINKYFTFILILLSCSPAYSVTLPLETNKKKFLREWSVQVELNQAKQRIAMRCLAYYRPNEAAWDAYIAQEFEDRAIPIQIWDTWLHHQLPFLDDEFDKEKKPIIDHLRKTLIDKIESLGGYNIYFEDWDNFQRMAEHIRKLEILNPLWETYKNLSGREPKTAIMFDIQKMSIAIRGLSRHIALARSIGSDDGSSTDTSDTDNNFY